MSISTIYTPISIQYLDYQGDLKWRFNSGGRIVNSVVFKNNMIIFGNDNGFLFALNEDGKLLWKFVTGAALRTRPEFFDNKIVFGSHDHNVYCLNKNGQKEWKFVTGGPMWTHFCIADCGKNVDSNTKYRIFFGGFDGGLYCLDSNGWFKWKFLTGGPVCSGPTLKNDNVYFGSTDGYFYSVDQKTGNLNWKFKALGKLGSSSPVFYNNYIFVCDYIPGDFTSGNLYCLNSDGELEWSFKTFHAIGATPVIHNDIIFVGSWDGYMYAIDIKKQALLWKFKTLFDKINFDTEKAVKYTEFQEEKSKQLFSVWKPETLAKSKDETKASYDSKTAVYNSNETTYGTASDNKRFSYSKNVYEKENSYKSRKPDYK
ncbi:PQQ-binding-like beta-propeller repeat protein [archaeon]|nr:PQQ-binding-like beta-propeller repeat protein [archaeon]